MNKIFAINPGSTSTKIGFFKDSEPVLVEAIRHSSDDINKFERIIDQLQFRIDAVNNFIEENNIDLKEVDYFIGRGGYLKPLESGMYRVNEKMKDDLAAERYGSHASNLGAIIADSLASGYGKPAFILDPICVDELAPVSRISGHPLFDRSSIFHALNQKKAARLASKKLGKKYGDINLIVAHLGGGITVGLHLKGRVVDVNNAIQGEGPFSPERSGAMELGSFLKYVFDNGLDFKESLRMILGGGGLVAYFGTTDFKEIMQRYESGKDEKVRLVVDAMAYQISKEIGAMSVMAHGKIDAIVITGGLVYSDTFAGLIKPMVNFLSEKIFVFPGENELEAMAEGILLKINGEIEVKEYS